MSRTTPFVSALLLLSAAFTTAASAQDYGSRGNLGETATATERTEIEALYERFVPYRADDRAARGRPGPGAVRRLRAGQTIARYFNAMNMEVTDWGVGILSMHSTYSVASKADLWALYEGFVAFFDS